MLASRLKHDPLNDGATTEGTQAAFARKALLSVIGEKGLARLLKMKRLNRDKYAPLKGANAYQHLEAPADKKKTKAAPPTPAAAPKAKAAAPA